MKTLRILLALVICGLVGCVGKPVKSYEVCGVNGNRMELRVRYRHGPSPRMVALQAKEYFEDVAKQEWASKGREVKTIVIQKAEIKKQALSLLSKYDLTGYALAGAGDSQVIDSSLLMALAEDAVARQAQAEAGLAALSGAVASAGATFQRNQQANMQALQLGQINSSIQQNTRAVEQLNRTVSAPIVMPRYRSYGY
jgi:hypothetical protein